MSKNDAVIFPTLRIAGGRAPRQWRRRQLVREWRGEGAALYFSVYGSNNCNKKIGHIIKIRVFSQERVGTMVWRYVACGVITSCCVRLSRVEGNTRNTTINCSTPEDRLSHNDGPQPNKASSASPLVAAPPSPSNLNGGQSACERARLRPP